MSLFVVLVFLISFSVINLSAAQDAAQEAEIPYPCELNFANTHQKEAFNKKIVLDLTASFSPPQTFRKAAEKYIDENYIQHNPHVGDGREAAITAFATTFKGTRSDFTGKVTTDGDYVWIHHKVVTTSGQNFAVVDIYRLNCGKIQEHWDVSQEIKLNEKFANAQPFF